MRNRGRTFITGVAAAAALALPGVASAADFGIGAFSVTTSTQQAGAHPDVTVIAFPAYDGAQTPRVRNVRLGFPPASSAIRARRPFAARRRSSQPAPARPPPGSAACR